MTKDEFYAELDNRFDQRQNPHLLSAKVLYGQLSRQFPCVASGGRSLDEDEASRFGGTSISTYLLGELLTYSENTLREYLEWQQELLRRGENMTKAILEETVRHYGFVSLDAAETHYRETALRCSNLST